MEKMNNHGELFNMKAKSWTYLATLCFAYNFLGNHFHVLGEVPHAPQSENHTSLTANSRELFQDSIYISEMPSAGIHDGNLSVSEVLFEGLLLSHATIDEGICPDSTPANETIDGNVRLEWSFSEAANILPTFAFESVSSPKSLCTVLH